MNGLQNQQVHIISQAAAPTEATWPKPTLLLPVAAALGALLGSGLALVLGARTATPSPAPAPATPDRPRRETPAKPQPVAVPRTPSRRYASLDAARSEIFGTATTPLATAVQILLKRILDALPDHKGPFVLAFSADDAALARYGAELAALGIERIGSRALLAEPQHFVDDAGQYNFLLVTADHYLADSADLDIIVVPRGEHVGSPQRGIVFELPPSPHPRPSLVGRAAASIAAAS